MEKREQNCVPGKVASRDELVDIFLNYENAQKEYFGEIFSAIQNLTEDLYSVIFQLFKFGYNLLQLTFFGIPGGISKLTWTLEP